jgi:hypothetical protein
MEVGEDKLLSLAKEMPKRQDIWEEIVRKFDLLAPANFQEFVGQSFVYTDFILGAGATELPPVLVSTITAVLIMVDPEANNLRGRTSLSRLLS